MVTEPTVPERQYDEHLAAAWGWVDYWREQAFKMQKDGFRNLVTLFVLAAVLAVLAFWAGLETGRSG